MVMMQSRLGCGACVLRGITRLGWRTSNVIGECGWKQLVRLRTGKPCGLVQLVFTGGSRVGDAEPVLLEAVLTLFFGCHVRSFHTR
jgi:hypothetical protein